MTANRRNFGLNPRTTSLLALLVIMTAIWGVYHSIRIGVADVAAYGATYHVEKWQTGSQPTADELDYALAKASSALAWVCAERQQTRE